MSTVIDVLGLRQGYGRTDVFTDFDLKVGQGVLGLLGPNGAGKTTLLETLATVSPPRAGVIRIDGEPVAGRRRIRAARRRIGFLPQHFGCYDRFTVREFVAYCAWLRELPKSSIDAAVAEAVDTVGLSDRAESKLSTLSGGMRQRVGIAQAVVGEPRVVLLDEPTVGLDPMQRIDFRDVIRRLPERSNATVVLSTHLAEDVAVVCDQVCVIDGGRKLFVGEPAGLADLAVPDARGDSPLERGYATILETVA